MSRPQVRVTETLRRQWRMQREQMLEEREHTQSGERRSPADIEIVDFDVYVMDHLLSLPLGTKFNGQDVQEDLLPKWRASRS